MNLARISRISFVWLLLLLTGVVLAGAGCASEPENESPKPWASPEGWQHGNLPTYMTQPH